MSSDAGKTRYPGYEVLNKRASASWDPITREVIEQRLATPLQPRFLNAAQWRTALALCNCVVAQPDDRPAAPVAAMLDSKLWEDSGDGYRDARLPPLREAWCVGLTALDAESVAAGGTDFAGLAPNRQHDLLQRLQHGHLNDAAWQGMPPMLFFSERVLHDLYAAYYSHPASWNDIGFGGPANPRGYVRMSFDRRDPWEAIEVGTDDEDKVRRENARVR
jgi:hypothetical protein